MLCIIKKVIVFSVIPKVAQFISLTILDVLKLYFFNRQVCYSGFCMLLARFTNASLIKFYFNLLFCSMRVHDEQLASPTSPTGITHNNNDIMKTPVQSPPAEPVKSAVQLALEQEEQAEANLYKGGNVQSKSFKLLEQELVAENELSGSTNGTDSEL